MRIKHAIIASMLLWCTNCVTAFPPPPRTAELSAGIVIGISLSPPISLFGAFNRAPDIVYFLRETSQRPTLEDLVMSRFKRGNRFYALGIKPGTYIPIGCTHDVMGDWSSLNKEASKYGVSLPGRTSYTTLFSGEMASAARVTSGSDGLVPMGDYIVDMSLNFQTADEFQKRNHDLFFVDLEEFGFKSYLNGSFLYTGTPRYIEMSPQKRAQFLMAVNGDLAGTEWVEQP